MITVFNSYCSINATARHNESINKSIKKQSSVFSLSLSLCLCVSRSFSASCSSSDSGLGLVDQLLNSRQVRDAPNILILHVTSFPFALQTQYTRISPYNEIHWPSAFSNVRRKSVSVKYRVCTKCTSGTYLEVNRHD